MTPLHVKCTHLSPWPIRLTLDPDQSYTFKEMHLDVEEAEALAKDLERAIMTYKHAQAEKMSPEQIERFMELATYEEG